MNRLTVGILTALVSVPVSAVTAKAPPPPPPPNLLLSSGKDLAKVKHLFKTGDPAVVAEVKQLRKSADAALLVPLQSVVNPKLPPTPPPPSTSVHDYVSLSRYAWPDPKKKDGLPWILKDGQVNPDIDKYDEPRLSRLSSTVRTLALAYYLTDDNKYAVRAEEQLREWFLKPATHMNPNMNFSGFRPGVNGGKGTGLTDAVSLTRILDAVILLEQSKSWTAADQKAIKKWYGDFLAWMETSTLGKGEDGAKNNHATWYDVNVSAMALFTGNTKQAHTVLLAVRTKRIATQIEPSGAQPLELARKTPFEYSCYNLEAFFDLAALGEHVGVDLWHYSSGGRSIRKGLDFLVPYATQKQPWPPPHTPPYTQITPVKWGVSAVLLRRAAKAYSHPAYETDIGQVPGGSTNLKLIDRLLYPS